MLLNDINRYMSMVTCVDNPAPSRRFYNVGDRFSVEVSAVSVDLASKNDVMNIWKKNGYVSAALPSWLSVKTYYTDDGGNCLGIYNITTKRDGAREVLDFDYLREATPENERELVAECIRLFCEGTSYTPGPSEPDGPEGLQEEPTGAQSIKFFWNGIKINGDKKLIRCRYSLDNYHDGHEGVTIYARDYSGHLPGDLFPVRNETDTYTDYFETDRAELEPGHPLYAYARAAAIKAELRNEKYYRAETCDAVKQPHLQRLWKYKQELLTLPTTQPTAADVEAVHALNLATKTARMEAEKEAEQKEREEVLRQQNEGRAYIESISAAHPIQEGTPVVTIQWSEHPAFYSWGEGELKLSVAAAEIVLKHYDELRAEHNAATQSGGYDKTSFLIEYTDQNGETSTYEGRYDLGDNDGGLIAHIRAFAETYRDKRLPYHSEEDAAQISALADLLEEHTAAGRVVSVSVAPWVEEAVKARREAAQRHMKETMETLEMLTDEQLTAAVLVSPRDNPDVARFFLQELSRRDTKKALAVLRAWKEGLGPEDIDRIA